MKKTMLLLFVVFSIVSYTQNGVEYKFEDVKTQHKDVWTIYKDDIVTIGDYKYICTYNAKDLTLDINKYDLETYKLLNTKKLTLRNLPRVSYYENIIHLKNGKHYFKYSNWDKPNKTEQLYVRELDIERGIFKGNPKLLIKSSKIVNESLVSSPFGYNFALKFPHFLNSDSSKIIFYYKKAPKYRNAKKNIDEYELAIFDDELKLINKENYLMPKVEQYIKIKGHYFFNDKLFLFIYDKEPNAKSDYAFLVFNEGKLDRINLDVSGLITYSPKTIEKDGNFYFIVSGYDAIDKFKDGVIIFKMNKDFSIQKSIYYFKENYVTNYYKNKRGEVGLKLKEIELDDDKISLICENIGTVYSKRSSGTYIYDCPEDIIIAEFDSDLKHLQDMKIPKKQYGNINTSYGYMKLEDGTRYFFYMNHLDNISKSLDETPKEYKMDRDGNFEVAIVSENGKITRKALFTLKELKAKVFPRKYTVNEDENFIIFDAKLDGKDKKLKVMVK